MSDTIYSTGLEDLDEILGGGLHSHSLVTIGARPGMGKTALMLSIATHLFESEVPFAYFSFAESNETIIKKLISNITRVNYENCFFPVKKENSKKYMLTKEEYQRIIDVTNKLEKQSNLISDNIYSIKELIVSMENAVKNDISIFFIDYIQVLSGVNAGDIYQDTSKTINELKLFANLNDVTIIIASQLSRKVDERLGHRPMMCDFRDTGTIEEASDQILLLLRREYYDPSERPGMGELIIPKNRFGYLGSVKVNFYREYFRFEKHIYA